MRTKHRIGALVLVLLLVWTAFGGALADPASQPASGNTAPLTETQLESSDASRNAGSREGDRQETPAEPFVPSESVSADSAVSFPVDI